jgi:hypothetical protein
MNYELAQELRDAGFPLRIRLNRLIQKVLEAPTLEELIEACGDRELVLSKHESAVDGKYEWRAIVLHQEPLVFGATPVEAIARLWLALNKPDQSFTHGN